MTDDDKGPRALALNRQPLVRLPPPRSLETKPSARPPLPPLNAHAETTLWLDEGDASICLPGGRPVDGSELGKELRGCRRIFKSLTGFCKRTGNRLPL